MPVAPHQMLHDRVAKVLGRLRPLGRQQLSRNIDAVPDISVLEL